MEEHEIISLNPEEEKIGKLLVGFLKALIKEQTGSV